MARPRRILAAGVLPSWFLPAWALGLRVLALLSATCRPAQWLALIDLLQGLLFVLLVVIADKGDPSGRVVGDEGIHEQNPTNTRSGCGAVERACVGADSVDHQGHDARERPGSRQTTGTAGAGFVARIEGDDLPQPPKVWIRQLPDDIGTLAADREPHEHASDRDPGLVPRPLQQLSLCYANLCAARLESGES